MHVDFVLTGIVMTFLGPMLPALSARWSLSDAQSGSLIFAEFFSSMFGMLLSGVLVQRLGYRLTLITGLVLMPSGLVLLAFGPWLVGIFSICLMGVGYGMTTPACNLRTAEVNPGRSASALNWINAVWGIGAMSSPFLVSLALEAGKPWFFLFSTAFALLLLLAVLVFSRFVPDHRQPVAYSEGSASSPWTMRFLPLICALFFIYVGTETSFGNWVAMYARRLFPGHDSLATMTPSFFWGALLAGRALAPLALKFSRETSVAKTGLLIAFAGGAALAAARGMSLIVAGTTLAGLGLASIFPISVSLLPGWFGAASRRASGAVFASGNVGGAVLPWVVGALSTQFGSLRVGFFIPLGGVIAMLVFYIANQNLRPLRQEAPMLQSS
ncbi:MAG: MFS transporter [Acidobacteria bacterium]|nr:MFS transporter [Acidobacteriota bacterium]MBV9624227.1 MFS transporter [Acidobacteriota bacterium]